MGIFSVILLHPVAKNDTGGALSLQTHRASLVAKKGRLFMVCIDNLVEGGIKQSLTLKYKTNRQYGKY